MDVKVLPNPLAVEVREEIIEVRVDEIPVAELNNPDNEEIGSELTMLDRLILLNKELRFKAVNSVVISDSSVDNRELREGVVTVTDPDPDAEAPIVAKIALMVLVILVAAFSTGVKEDRGREPTILPTLTLSNRFRVDNNEVISDSKSLI